MLTSITNLLAMGGVAILVRNKIKQQQMPKFNLSSLESRIVLINLNNIYATFVNAYQPPSC